MTGLLIVFFLVIAAIAVGNYVLAKHGIGKLRIEEAEPSRLVNDPSSLGYMGLRLSFNDTDRPCDD